MKKVLLPVLSVLVLFSVSACVRQAAPAASPSAAQTPPAESAQPAPSAVPTSMQSPVPTPEEYDISGYIEKQTDSMSLYTQGMTRLDVRAIHLTRDKLAVLELYVDAQLDDKGEIMYDDGQEWALVVRDGDAMYPLFEKKYVQIGEVSFTEDWQPGEERSQITVRVRQHEFLDSYICIYQPDQERFARVDLPQQTVTE